MNKLVTINPQKSTTMGGVETLIRNIQEIAIKNKCEDLYELHELMPRSEFFPEGTGIDYRCYGVDHSFKTMSKILTKINQLNLLSSLDFNAGDRIVIFHPNDLLYIPISYLKNCKVILVQTNRFDMFFGKVSKIIMKLRMRYVDVFTVYTQKDKDVFFKIYPGFSGEVSVIPRGCKIKTSKGIVAHSKKLVSIARIDEKQKNFQEMVRIIKMLPEDYSLDIYGDGNADEIEALINIVETDERIKYKGTALEVDKVLNEYSAFLLTSRYEGFGQTLIEARSQGLPIVAYNNFDALTWIVEDGYNGFVVNNNDRVTFCKKIESMCADRGFFDQLSKNALHKAKETEKEYVDKMWSRQL